MALYAAFDVETRIDWDLIAQVEGMDREEFLNSLNRDKRPLDKVWVPHSYHVPIAIAVGFLTPEGGIGSVGSIRGDEQELTASFWTWLERWQARPKNGVIVSFNGRGFDFPVLELAALRYSVPAPNHWNEKYGNRYRFQDDHHIDVLDLVTGFGGARGLRGGLSLLSGLMGLVVKDTHGADVQALHEAGQREHIDRYCRNDVRRLLFIFGRLQYIRGKLETPPPLPELEVEPST